MDLLSINDINIVAPLKFALEKRCHEVFFNDLSSALDHGADSENSKAVLTIVNKLKINLIMILIIKKLKTLICCFGTPI